MSGPDPFETSINLPQKGGKINKLYLYSKGLRDVAIYSSSASIGQVILMLYALIMARWLGPDLFGVMGACYTAASLSVFFISWGMDTWLLRNGGIEVDSNRLTAKVLQIKFLFVIFWGPALWIIFTLARPDVFLPSIFALSIIDIALEGGFSTLTSAFLINNRIRQISILVVLSRVLRLLSAVLLILLDVNFLIPFVIARLSTTLILFVIAILLIKPGVFKRQGITTGSIIRESLPFGASDFLATVYGQIDVVMISVMTSRILVGLYSPAVSIINAIVTAIGSSYQYFIPRLTRRIISPENSPRIIARKLFLGYFSIGAILWLGFWVFGQWVILVVLGDKYQTTGNLIVVLSPILFLKSLSICCASILVAAGWQKKRIVPQIVSAVSNVGLNLWAIPNFGVVGAANVYVASEVVLLAGYAYWTIRFLRRSQSKIG